MSYDMFTYFTIDMIYLHIMIIFIHSWAICKICQISRIIHKINICYKYSVNLLHTSIIEGFLFLIVPIIFSGFVLYSNIS